jgi:hypothetical protein
MEVKDYSKAPKQLSHYELWKDRPKFVQICNKNKDIFMKTMEDHKFQTAGIFYAEAFAFLNMCELYDIDLILESGMARGNSTEIFLKNFKGEVITFEYSKKDYHTEVEKRLMKYKNLKKIMYEDSMSGFERVISENLDKRIALFIDGPKDLGAVSLAKKSFNNQNVKFCGIHDITNPVTKMRANYGFMDYFKESHILSTDEKLYRQHFGYMDDIIEDPNGAWIYNSSGVSEHTTDKNAIKKRFPYGPGIGIALNTN